MRPWPTPGCYIVAMAGLSEERAVQILREQLALPSDAVALGIGDDAALVRAPSGQLVLSVDASVEGVHFRQDWVGLRDVGYRSFQAAVSDLAAMGAVPVAALSALTLPGAWSETGLRELAEGQAAAARESLCPIVGGNIARGRDLTITTTVLGSASRPLLRSGARPGDSLWLLGALGEAAAGLVVARRQAARPARHLGWAIEHCLQAWRRPRAQLDAGRALAGMASAAIDVSDGLLLDAHRLARSSQVALWIDRNALRRARSAALISAARELGLSAERLMLGGGEDYALLATSPASQQPPGAIRLGFVGRGHGVRLLDRGAAKFVSPAGFDHFRSRAR